MSVLALASVLIEVFLAVALWSERWRSAAIGVGVAFHAAIVLGVSGPAPHLVFAILVLAGYVLFVSPDAWDRISRGLPAAPLGRKHRIVAGETGRDAVAGSAPPLTEG